VTGSWTGLHNEKLNNLYASPNIVSVIKSKRVRRADRVACMGEIRNLYKILVRNSEWKRPLLRSSQKLER
jgi:hypothetical protein